MTANTAELKQNAADRAGDCPVCDRTLEANDVQIGKGKNGDEYLYGFCRDCDDCRYDDDDREWWEMTPPGTESPTWDV